MSFLLKVTHFLILRALIITKKYNNERKGMFQTICRIHIDVFN